MHEQIASIRKIPSEEELEELIELGNNGAIDWIADHLADIVLSILTSSAKRLLEDNLSYDSIDWDFIENAAIHYFAKVGVLGTSSPTTSFGHYLTTEQIE